MQFALKTVAEAATRESSSKGLELLRHGPWAGHHFATGLGGYTAGLDRGTNWMEVRSSLREIVEERIATMTVPDVEGNQERWEQTEVDFAVARQWAQRDLDAAMAWYAEEATVKAIAADRPLTILLSLPDRHRVATWLEDHLGTGLVNEALVVRFAQRIASQPMDGVAERLIQLPGSEQTQVRILSSFGSTVQRNGQPFLRHPPESLRRLIDAAVIPEAERTRWIEIVANTPYQEP